MVSSGGKHLAQARRTSLMRIRIGGLSLCRNAVVISVVALASAFVFFGYRLSSPLTAPASSTLSRDKSVATTVDQVISSETKSLAALEQIESLFPKEVLDVVNTNAADSSLPDLRSLSVEEPSSIALERIKERRRKAQSVPSEDPLATLGASTADHASLLAKAAAEGEDPESLRAMEALLKPDPNDPARRIRRENRIRRRDKRLHELVAQESTEDDAVEAEEKKKKGSGSEPAVALNKYSIWRREDEKIGGDQMVRLIQDQLIMARAYMAIAQQHGDSKLSKELKNRMKDSTKSLGEATTDAELASNAVEKMRAMGQLLARARDQHYDCTGMVKKLRAMVHSAEEQNQALRQQSLFLSQLAAKTIPKGIFCLSMRLTIEYSNLSPEEREFTGKEKLEDNDYHHYALFSDNVLATAVVVNSTVVNANDSSRHVFHIVTDKLNIAAMKAWFLFNPPKDATIEVQSVDSFTWLNSSYCPVLRQLESASMKDYYFKTGQQTETAGGATANLKYRNPKYLSMLNHLRFYLPEVFPKLDKVLFLDDDIVVQKDLTPLWEIDLHGNVNGAVETCGASFHRFDKYLNFSNPLIASNFDPQACGWAYGMNVFDLKQWKVQDITGIYHRWQTQNEDRTLWKLGTLPPGLITFYNKTQPIDKSWHALGLGYNPNLDMDELNSAAVVHYNGNMKPWLEISMTKFKRYWTKYVKIDHPFMQQCNVSP
ncbi:hypothetical protein CLOM_g6864 [Closterium sp. NIES-68]|nr:hypothetical protein CLOM_g17711 [Closterium sp. NIES-68]GJP47691.1 hypothetical protein CLOM_g6864 [Closterium sp. NIES-68]GJP59187.1 hypothetical protein CLOP_g9424 [Closterium sp. NIES-67]GJP61467.1 hypothetical protein CLOP_g18623 [Closterium sp. NIES-67]